jgi:hypothetical protein
MRFHRRFLPLAMALFGAALVQAQDQLTLTVDATMDIYRAGGYNDGSDGIAPVVFTFPAQTYQTMTFPSAGGGWSCQNGYPDFGPDGETSGYCFTASAPANLNAVGPFSGYRLTDFTGALVGVFLANTLPLSAPAALRFYVSDSSKGGTQTNFLELSPKIGQTFFIGDGLTRTGIGTIQTFKVPATATHLYLGYVDTCKAPNNTAPGCYSDNTGSLTVTARLQSYAPDWVEPALSSAPSPRISPALAYDPLTNANLLFGGSSSFIPGVSYGDTWIWRNGWTQRAPATSPHSRGDAGMAYDAATGTTVLFGGEDNANNGIVFGDTWTWDGLTWTEQFPLVSPPARTARGAMVYNPATQTVLLFGGTGSNNGDYGGVPFGDTWEWNGKTKTWTQKFPLVSPSPRAAPLAFDELTRNVVLFGGDNGGGDCCRVYYNDTWTWNGTAWTLQTPPSSPSARTAAPMAYDPRLGQVVLFGGTSGPPYALNDTWGWNGKTWTQLQVYTAPGARYLPSMDFDSVNNGLLLFGGQLTGNTAVNQTWFLISVPVP